MNSANLHSAGIQAIVVACSRPSGQLEEWSKTHSKPPHSIAQTTTNPVAWPHNHHDRPFADAIPSSSHGGTLRRKRQGSRSRKGGPSSEVILRER
ncbi:hypothetical protein FCV25MIE_12777 [Fagus crenata]